MRTLAEVIGVTPGAGDVDLKLPSATPWPARQSSSDASLIAGPDQFDEIVAAMSAALIDAVGEFSV